MRLDVREIAHGRWPGILAALGIDSACLTGKHTACPMCGGKDRFRFDDKEGRGTFFCTNCRSGDGFDLLMKLKGMDFRAVAREVEQAAGIVPKVKLTHALGDEEKLKALRRVWSESRPLTAGDDAMRYLAGRGLEIEPPAALRLHPALAYRDGADLIGKFAAMLALVSGPDGNGVTLHRTYLKDGRKAPVPSAKKLMPGKATKGAAIRLFPADETLGVAEGIETAIAAHKRFDVPVWSCIATAGIESFEPPAGVRKVIVFGDNDENFAGQKAAMVLAQRLSLAQIKVEVRIPEIVGTDWADV